MSTSSIVTDPIVDDVLLPSNGKITATQIQFYISSELMKNQATVSALDPTTNIQVVQDKTGQALIFTIGTDKKFHLLKPDSTSATGQTVVDLSITGYATATTFGVSQDLNGNITVVVAMSKTGSQATDVFVTSMLSNDPAKTDWTKFAFFAKKVSNISTDFIAEKVMLGTSDDGKFPLTVVAGSIKSSKYYYNINGAGSSFTAVQCEFPQNLAKTPNALMDMDMGYAFGQRATFFLYQVGSAITLEATTIATEDEGVEHYDYSATNSKLPSQYKSLNLKYTCIATSTGSNSNLSTITSDIYVGTTTGIYFFKGGRMANFTKITDQLKDVREITVKEDSKGIAIWALVNPSQLYYIYGTKKGSTYTFNDPILFRDSVIHIAPMRNKVRNANELYVVNQDTSISHLWQDASTTIWQERKLKVKDSSETIEFNSYTTHIHLEDGDGNALINTNVKLTASEWTYVNINGLLYSLDTINPATVTTDSLGNITIIATPGDISSSVYRLQADFFDKIIYIYPHGKVRKNLKTIQSGGDLKNAVGQDGKPVLSKTYDDATLSGTAANLKQLTDYESTYNDSPDAAYTFIALKDKTATRGLPFDMSDIQPSVSFGFAYINGELRLISPEDVVEERGITSIVTTVGDALHTVGNYSGKGTQYIKDGVTYLGDGVSFVVQSVKEGLQLMISLPGQLLKVIVNSLPGLYKVMQMVLELLEIALEKALTWIGHLIGWDKILAASDDILTYMNQHLAAMVGAIPTITRKIDNAFTSLEKKIAGEDVANDVQDGGNVDNTGQKFSKVLHNPVVNWIQHHMMHTPSFMLFTSGKSVNTNSIFADIETALKDLLKAELVTLESGLEEMMQSVLTSIKNKESVGTIYLKLVKILAVVALEEVRHVVDGVMALLEAVLSAFQKLVNMEIKIPVLTTVLKAIIGDRKLSIARFISLTLAVGGRILAPIITGKALSTSELVNATEYNTVLKNDETDTTTASTQSRHLSQAVYGETLTVIDRDTLSRGSTRDEDYVEVPKVYGIIYVIGRYLEGNFGVNTLFYSNTAEAGDTETQDTLVFIKAAGGVLSLLNTGMVIADTVYINQHQTVKSIPNGYEIAGLAMTVVRFSCSFLGLFLSTPTQKKVLKSTAMIMSAMLVIEVIIDYAETEYRDRSNKLRLSSNVLANTYSAIINYPGKIENPEVAFAVAAVAWLSNTAHAALVGARLDTDYKDKVSFKIS